MPFAESIDNSILDHFFGKSTWTAPTAVWLALSTTTPTKTGTNVTEPSGNGYARKQLTSAQVDSAASSATQNNTEKAFDEATGSWGTVTHVVLYTAVTGGTFLGFKALDASRAIDSGDTPRFAGGALDFAMGGS